MTRRSDLPFGLPRPWKALLIALGAASFVTGFVAAPSVARPKPSDLQTFTRAEVAARLPVAREVHYIVNARIRPLLFWIGRDDVGHARITWRQGRDGERGIEFLIGSDPARAPRKINRWGFVAEETTAAGGEMLGLMKGAKEETIEEAEASVTNEAGKSTFKAVRTRIVGRRAFSGTVTLEAPSKLTYQQLDALLALLPHDPPLPRTIDLPDGTERGFLAAMSSVMAENARPCRDSSAAPKPVRSIPYLYNQTIYTLALVSCDYIPALDTAQGVFDEVIDARFLVRNPATGEVTKFRVAYSCSAKAGPVPVRIVFRPRWWFEVDLWLDRKATPTATSALSPAS